MDSPAYSLPISSVFSTSQCKGEVKNGSFMGDTIPPPPSALRAFANWDTGTNVAQERELSNPSQPKFHTLADQENRVQLVESTQKESGLGDSQALRPRGCYLNTSLHLEAGMSPEVLPPWSQD